MASLICVARPKSFSTGEVLRLAAHTFTAGGYEGTSVDDLVQALNLHRGSLYKEFGSKRGLFLAVLGQYVGSALPTAIQAAADSSGDTVEDLIDGTDLDLLLIAAVERGHRDPQVAALVQQAIGQLEGMAAARSPGAGATAVDGAATTILGARLRRRLLAAPGNSDIQEGKGI